MNYNNPLCVKALSTSCRTNLGRYTLALLATWDSEFGSIRIKPSKVFTEKYNLTKLVGFQAFDEISTAIEYEKKVKAWRREKRVALIEEKNSRWEDLAENWYSGERLLAEKPDPSVG